MSNIQVITTKLVSVFAARFSPDLDADTLCDYLTETLGNKSVTCRKIETARNRYSSFHITAECNDISDMYNPQLWLARIYVRRYYEACGHKPHATGRSDSGIDPQRLGVKHTPLALHGSHSLVFDFDLVLDFNGRKLLILNVYTPYECYENEDDYLNRLASIMSFIQDSPYTCIYVIGDMNADQIPALYLLSIYCRSVRIVD